MTVVCPLMGYVECWLDEEGRKKGQVLWHFISDHDITVYTSACFHERKKKWIHKNSLNNQISESIICHNDELSWLFTNRVSAIKHMKVKRMGITEILRRIWLFSLIKIKSSLSFYKQPTQLIIEFNSSLRQIIDSQALLVYLFIVETLGVQILPMTVVWPLMGYVKSVSKKRLQIC